MLYDISSPRFPHSELRQMVEEIIEDHLSEEEIEIKGPRNQVRQFDATVIVSILGVSGTILASLISGLLAVLAQRQGQKIVIKSKSGNHIEFPVDTPASKVQEYIAAVESLDHPKIILQ